MPTREDRKIFVGMPGYGELTAGAARGFWRATRLPDSHVVRQYNEGSLLAQNFNTLWVTALNRVHRGERVDYFAMQHADIEPCDYWLDMLIDELEARDLDVLGVVAPIKDQKGMTSIALAHETGDSWRIKCRLTMSDVYRLPETFTSDDIGHPILLNTGLWVCRFGEWTKQVRFTINDRVAFDTKLDRYVAQVEPEDWYFARLCHELGLKIGCTRKIPLDHRGVARFTNTRPWGTQFHDQAWADESPVPTVDADGFRFPFDVEGWLRFEEGKALFNLAKGKRVLEIGSYCGKSTICLAQSANEVHSIDPHDGRGTAVPQDTSEALRTNLWNYGVKGKVNIIRGCFNADDVRQVESGFSPPFDLVFIDGAHDYDSVRSDIENASRVLAPGGLLAFHDYHSSCDPGVTAAVDELLADGGELLSTHSTLAVVRPPAAISVEV